MLLPVEYMLMMSHWLSMLMRLKTIRIIYTELAELLELAQLARW
jgi:hypothetical protein